MSVAKGLYKHVNRYGNIKVLGMARCHNNPSKKLVVYKQLYNDIVKDNAKLEHFPYGSLFIQDLNEFKTMFKKFDYKDHSKDDNETDEETYYHLYQ